MGCGEHVNCLSRDCQRFLTITGESVFSGKTSHKEICLLSFSSAMRKAEAFVSNFTIRAKFVGAVSECNSLSLRVAQQSERVP